MIEGMRQTGAWPAVQELRRWTRPWLEVPAGGAVLDVGCGLGEVLIDLAGTGIGARPVGPCGRERDGRLRGLALRAGCEDVRVRGATAAIRMVARLSEAPPGWMPPRIVGQALLEDFGLSQGDAQEQVDALVEAARRGRFQLAVSLMAVTTRRPTPAKPSSRGPHARVDSQRTPPTGG